MDEGRLQPQPVDLDKLGMGVHVSFGSYLREHVALWRFFARWLVIAGAVGVCIGTAVAVFLYALDAATNARWNHPWLLYLLPLCGVAVGGFYHLYGKSVEGGNNLIVEQIHEPGGGVPSRMAPMVLIGTVLTHLFGGSAGREGTAVQMGGSIASTIGRRFGFSPRDMRIILMAGVAAGFGAVFGTPLAGAIFAIEVLAVGRISYEALIPCLIASIVADQTCTRLDIRAGAIVFHVLHTPYRVSSFAAVGLDGQSAAALTLALLWRVAVCGVAFGLAGVVFAEMVHAVQSLFKRFVPWPILRPAVGGLCLIPLALFVGGDYLGLGVRADPHHPGQVCILSCFVLGGATYWSWLWKTLFTALTLGAGFKGGEVTPLFFVGAALGNACARVLGVPEHADLFAALGFVAVFAGATNTPLACIIMGVELFAAGSANLLGSGFVVYLAVACATAYLFSGHGGIYLSQRIASPKIDSPHLPENASLRSVRGR